MKVCFCKVFFGELGKIFFNYVSVVTSKSGTVGVEPVGEILTSMQHNTEVNLEAGEIFQLGCFVSNFIH